MPLEQVLQDEPTIHIKEVTTEPDKLTEVEDCAKRQLTLAEVKSDQRNDMEELLSNTDIEHTNLEDSSFTIKDEPLSSIDIKEEVITEPDKFMVVEDCTKRQLTFADVKSDQGNDMEELLSNTCIEHTNLDDSSFTIKDEPLSSIDIKEEVTTEPGKLMEVEDCTKRQLTFAEVKSDQGNDMEELLSNTYIEHTNLDDSSFTIKDEPLSSIDIIEEVITEPDKLMEVEDCTKRQLTLAEVNSNLGNDVEEPLSMTYIQQTNVDDSSFTIKDERQSSIDIKEEVISEPDKLMEVEDCTKNLYNMLHTKRSSLIEEKQICNLKKKWWVCHICDKKFDYNSSLIRHIRTHTGEKQCNVCNKKFNQKNHLVSHMRIHTGEKPYACNVCDKKFNKKNHLATHMKIHTGVKLFACNVCDKKCNQKHHLVRHMRIHTGIKLFSCDVCNKKFNQKHHVVLHMRIHTGERPFACDVCDKQFNRKHHLDKHIMRTHTGITRIA